MLGLMYVMLGLVLLHRCGPGFAAVVYLLLHWRSPWGVYVEVGVLGLMYVKLGSVLLHGAAQVWLLLFFLALTQITIQ